MPAGSGSTPAFGLAGPDGEALAVPGSPAAGEVDLLTVLEHELGHLIGLDDTNQPDDLMDITLGLGVRRSPTATDLATIVQTSGTGVAPNEIPGPVSTASVSQTTVDAALASIIIGPTIASGNVADPIVNVGVPARSAGRISLVGDTGKSKGKIETPR